jgi:hypothetical protein
VQAVLKEKERGRPKNAHVQDINENTESFKNYIGKFRSSPNTKINYWLKRFVELT